MAVTVNDLGTSFAFSHRRAPYFVSG